MGGSIPEIQCEDHQKQHQKQELQVKMDDLRMDVQQQVNGFTERNRNADTRQENRFFNSTAYRHYSSSSLVECGKKTTGRRLEIGWPLEIIDWKATNSRTSRCHCKECSTSCAIFGASYDTFIEGNSVIARKYNRPPWRYSDCSDSSSSNSREYYSHLHRGF